MMSHCPPQVMPLFAMPRHSHLPCQKGRVQHIKHTQNAQQSRNKWQLQKFQKCQSHGTSWNLSQSSIIELKVEDKEMDENDKLLEKLSYNETLHPQQQLNQLNEQQQQQLQTKIPVLFENDHLLAICKPPHIPHHDDPNLGQLGILSLIRCQQQQMQKMQQMQQMQQLNAKHSTDSTKSTNSTLSFSNIPQFPYPHRLYGIHRLDKVTSGILLLAKDSTTAQLLSEKFRRKEVIKYYAAISGKKAKKKKQGWVKGWMAKGRRGNYMLENERNVRNETKSKNGHKGKKGKGEEADHCDDCNDVNNEQGEQDEHDNEIESTFSTNSANSANPSSKKRIGYAITRFFTAGLGNIGNLSNLAASSSISSSSSQLPMGVPIDVPTTPKTAILFRPHTGKTHQLRVAAKSLGIPILGDVRYGGGRAVGAANAVGEVDGADYISTVDADYADGALGTVGAVGSCAERYDCDRTFLHACAIHLEWNKTENVTIYSPPPFDWLFESGHSLDNGAGGQGWEVVQGVTVHKSKLTEIQKVFVTMMEKYCDCHPILEAMHGCYNTSDAVGTIA